MIRSLPIFVEFHRELFQVAVHHVEMEVPFEVASGILSQSDPMPLLGPSTVPGNGLPPELRRKLFKKWQLVTNEIT